MVCTCTGTRIPSKVPQFARLKYWCYMPYAYKCGSKLCQFERKQLKNVSPDPIQLTCKM